MNLTGESNSKLYKLWQNIGILIIFFAGMLVFADNGQSQTVEVINKLGKKYHLKIDDKDYLAYEPDYIKRKLFELDSLRIECRAAKAKFSADTSLFTSYENTIKAYKKNLALKDSARVVYTNLYQGYKNLYYDYKKAYSDPWLYVSGGVGVLREGDDDHDILPVVLLGLSVKKISLWGFVNKEQSGFILGFVQPIRFNFSLF